jgi:glycosyltransferase involved in cell wall biosynthesis
VPRADLLLRMPSFHVLAHPSLHDSGAFVCMEAMASGCPVICLNVGGPAVQVDRTCGFAIAATSQQEAVAGIAEALQQLRERPDLLQRLSDGGRARVIERLSFVRYMDSLSEFYGSAANSTEIAAEANAMGVH